MPVIRHAIWSGLMKRVHPLAWIQFWSINPPDKKCRDVGRGARITQYHPRRIRSCLVHPIRQNHPGLLTACTKLLRTSSALPNSRAVGRALVHTDRVLGVDIRAAHPRPRPHGPRNVLSIKTSAWISSPDRRVCINRCTLAATGVPDTIIHRNHSSLFYSHFL